MTVIAQMIADRLVLKPTRHEIPTTGKSRLTIPFRRGVLEVWTQQAGMTPRSEPEFYVLKFQGTAGRAERSTYHPLDYWTERRAELWSVNPPGYGGSSGSASLRTLSAAAETVYQELVRVANGRPIVIMGNSLGTISALYLAARHDIAGMVLRNPPRCERSSSAGMVGGTFGLARF